MNKDGNRNAFLESILERNLAWIAAADSKVPPVLAIDTAMLGVLAASLPDADLWRVVTAITAAVATLLLLASIASLISATFPRLAGPKSSLIFFGGIAARDSEQYLRALLSADSAELARDLATQIHRNAEICEAKYRGVRFAMIFLYLAVPAWLVSVVLLYADN